jgi:hypothetical protein
MIIITVIQLRVPLQGVSSAAESVAAYQKGVYCCIYIHSNLFQTKMPRKYRIIRRTNYWASVRFMQAALYCCTEEKGVGMA